MKNYQIALTNVDFDNSYENCVRFDSRAEQEGYFKCNTLFADAPVVNFDFGTLLTARVPVRKDLVPTKLMGCNYLIVKDISDDKDLNYLYYFIRDIYYDTNNQVILDIELDVINTYLLDIDFSDCFIEKAHLNRFIDNGDNTVSFDGSADSKLFETEDLLELPKRLTKRTKLKLNTTLNTTADEWLNNNVAFWVYIFIDKSHSYNVKNLTDNPGATVTYSGSNMIVYYNLPDGARYYTEYAVVAYPIYKSNKVIKINHIRGTHPWQISLDRSALNSFKDDNNNTSYFYTQKFSLIAPFKLNDATCTITDGNLIINSRDDASNNHRTHIEVANSAVIVNNEGHYDNVYYGSGLVTTIIQQNTSIESDTYNTNIQYTFDKSEIINANKKIKFNPKLLGGNFKELLITSQGDMFKYDMQKLNGNSLKFLYSEPIQSEITKFYFRLKAPQGLYTDDTDNNFMGLVGNVDNSQAIANDNYSNFLANNKNFWLQSNIKLGENLFNAMSSGVKGAMSGASATPGGMIAGFIGGSIGGVANTFIGAVDRNLTVDNMKNAPGSLQNANGNAIFNMFVNDLALYVEEYDALNNEKEMVNDVMFKNGFTVNRIGNVKDYLNIRKYFNYVRARLENITSTLQLNNNVREKFKMIFANGVRFWNVTDKMFEYKKENYERWLENEL